MRRLIRITLPFVLGLLPTACLAKGQKPAVRCASAAFSPQGDLAEVTTSGQTLDLEIIRPGGARQSGRAAIRTDQYGNAECSVFLSRDGDLAAVVTRVPLDDGESVLVWKLAAAKWQSSFHITPRPRLEGQNTVLGFWGGGHNMAVESAKLLDKGGVNQALALVLLDTSGNVVEGPQPVHFPEVDVDRGRVWVESSTPSGGCFYSPETMGHWPSLAPQAGAPGIPCECFAGDFIGFPGVNSIVRAAELEGYKGTPRPDLQPRRPAEGKGKAEPRGQTGTVVSLCNIAANGCKQLVIPAPRKHLLDAYVEAGPGQLQVSPRGGFFAVQVQVTRWGYFDIPRAVLSELYVFQTAPFEEISKIGPKKGCDRLLGFAVGDADGKAHIAMNWCGKWTFETANAVAENSRR